MNIKDTFIEQFNKLDRYLKEEQDKGDEHSFKYKLKNSNNSLIQNKKNRDLLELSGTLRNLIVHNTDINIAIPTEDFVERFEKLVTDIIKPQRVMHIMIQFQYMHKCRLSDTLKTTYDLMQKFKLTNIPVFDGNKFIGIFSESSLFHHTAKIENDIVSMNETTLLDIKEAININNQPSIYYKFIKKKLDVYKALDIFLNKSYSNNKRLELLLVTENGKPSENLLGIVSPYDLLHLVES